MSGDVDMDRDAKGDDYPYSSAGAEEYLNKARARNSTVDQRHAALKYLINAVSNLHSLGDLASEESLFVLAAQSIPELLAEFPKEMQEASDAIWDLCEMELQSVRLVAYKAVIQMLQIGVSPTYIREAADLLLQAVSYMDAAEGEQEIGVINETLNSIFSTDPVAFARFIEQTLQDETDEECERRKQVLWEFLESKASEESRGNVYSSSEAEGMFIDIMVAAIEKVAREKRLIALTILIPCPMLTGPNALPENSTYLLNLITKSLEREGDTEHAVPILYVLGDFDARVTPKPDPRHYLELFCKLPTTVFDWALVDFPREGESPSRLLEWESAGWVLWKKEFTMEQAARRKGNLYETCQQVVKKAIAGIPFHVHMPPGVTYDIIAKHSLTLEILLNLAHYLCVKFKFKFENIFETPELKDQVILIRSLAEQAIAAGEKQEDSKCSVRRWDRIMKLCKKLVNPSESIEIPPPSWTIPAAEKTQPVLPTSPMEVDPPKVKEEAQPAPTQPPIDPPKVKPEPAPTAPIRPPVARLKVKEEAPSTPIQPPTPFSKSPLPPPPPAPTPSSPADVKLQLSPAPASIPAAPPKPPPSGPRNPTAARGNGIRGSPNTGARPSQFVRPSSGSTAPERPISPSATASSSTRPQPAPRKSLLERVQPHPSGPSTGGARSVSMPDQKRKRPGAGEFMEDDNPRSSLAVHGASTPTQGGSLVSRLGLAAPGTSSPAEKSEGSASKRPRVESAPEKVSEISVKGLVGIKIQGGSKPSVGGSLLGRIGVDRGAVVVPPERPGSAGGRRPRLLERIKDGEPTQQGSMNGLARSNLPVEVSGLGRNGMHRPVPILAPPPVRQELVLAEAPAPSPVFDGVVRRGRGFQNTAYQSATTPPSTPPVGSSVSSFSIMGAGRK